MATFQDRTMTYCTSSMAGIRFCGFWVAPVGRLACYKFRLMTMKLCLSRLGVPCYVVDIDRRFPLAALRLPRARIA